MASGDLGFPANRGHNCDWPRPPRVLHLGVDARHRSLAPVYPARSLEHVISTSAVPYLPDVRASIILGLLSCNDVVGRDASRQAART